jgi:hypothetical protein
MGPVDAEVLEQSAQTFLDGQCGFRCHDFFPKSSLRRRGVTPNSASGRAPQVAKGAPPINAM